GNKRLRAGTLMIESTHKPLACVDRQIELKLVVGACRGVRPSSVFDLGGVILQVDLASPSRVDTRRGVEKPRQLRERDRPLVVEDTARMPLPQEVGGRKDCL